ncbi:hypothetical protein CDAR_236371 [Caerostris darwini]|uniref:Uncharacterized protein n=1 Tax=Caerostris darwini TaxID=1538125 RepID=A0AAV4T7V6_9ARAC|nr:hypothetical protein CDAR_236371 [Caerostris darwini]
MACIPEKTPTLAINSHNNYSSGESTLHSRRGITFREPFFFPYLVFWNNPPRSLLVYSLPTSKTAYLFWVGMELDIRKLESVLMCLSPCTNDCSPANPSLRKRLQDLEHVRSSLVPRPWQVINRDHVTRLAKSRLEEKLRRGRGVLAAHS